MILRSTTQENPVATAYDVEFERLGRDMRQFVKVILDPTQVGVMRCMDPVIQVEKIFGHGSPYRFRSFDSPFRVPIR